MTNDFFFHTIDNDLSFCYWRPIGEPSYTSFDDAADMFALAVMYGWQPMGTINRGIDDWDGSYLLSENQLVTREDALNLAQALSRALTDKFQKLEATHRRHLLSSMESLVNCTRREVAFIEQGEFHIA
jgi:hypothetical protein